MTVLDYAMMVEDSVINTFVTEYRVKPENPLQTQAGEMAAGGGRAVRPALRRHLDGLQLL